MKNARHPRTSASIVEGGWYVSKERHRKAEPRAVRRDQRQARIVSEKAGTAKSELLRRSLGLYDIAADAKEDGLKLGLLKKDRTVVTEIIGI